MGSSTTILFGSAMDKEEGSPKQAFASATEKPASCVAS